MRVGVKPSGQNFTCCRAAKEPGKKVCGKSKKVVDKDTLFGYNSPCQKRRAAPDKPNNGDLHSGSAVDSDSTCGSSILSSPTRPQPNRLRYFRGIAQLVARLVRDEEAVGSNPAAPTKKNQYTFVYWFFFVSARDLNRAAVRSTANKAIVWLCLARGFHRLGMSNKVHAARSSGICNPKSFDLCSKYDILERQSHIWLQNGQKSEEKQKLCRKQKRKNGRSRFL